MQLKLPKCNKRNGVTERHFGKEMTTKRRLCPHKITSNAALRYGWEVWNLYKKRTMKLEASQMRL
jgi:hypothetical protein